MHTTGLLAGSARVSLIPNPAENTRAHKHKQTRFAFGDTAGALGGQARQHGCQWQDGLQLRSTKLNTLHGRPRPPPSGHANAARSTGGGAWNRTPLSAMTFRSDTSSSAEKYGRNRRTESVHSVRDHGHLPRGTGHEAGVDAAGGVNGPRPNGRHMTGNSRGRSTKPGWRREAVRTC